MFTTRLANSKDYDFLFDLKKAAEYEPIKAIFGWDETIQKKIHQQEWNENRPIIIEVEGSPVGSYLVDKHADDLYFGRLYSRFGFEITNQDSQFLYMCKVFY